MTCPPQVLLGKARSHSGVAMMAVDDSNNESATAVFSDALVVPGSVLFLFVGF